MALRLFEGYGVELEYMIVDAATLRVRPVADVLLKRAAGAAEEEWPSDYDVPGTGITWSNELTAHLIELKTSEPVRSLTGLAAAFSDSVRRANALLCEQGCRLMPGAMHPFMDPLTEKTLWPHDSSEYYEAFDRIFDCRGHGWANLQSCHLNLPFEGDEEFGRLHAAIRLILPILPALAASSPIMDGRATGTLDNRLAVYRTNARKVPSVSGRVIPEPVFTRADYTREILERIYADLAPHDPEGILREEWANARGAIARFTRGSIEIRVLDVQECPAADLAIVFAVVAVLKDLVRERWTDLAAQRAWEVEPLERVLLACIEEADGAVIRDGAYLETLGIRGQAACAAGEVWRHLVEASVSKAEEAEEFMPALRVMLDEGPLARRIARAVAARGGDRAAMESVYTDLCGCVAAAPERGGGMFRGA